MVKNAVGNPVKRQMQKQVSEQITTVGNDDRHSEELHIGPPAAEHVFWEQPAPRRCRKFPVEVDLEDEARSAKNVLPYPEHLKPGPPQNLSCTNE